MWQQHFASFAASLGFERLKSDSNLNYHPERRCYMLCYVDELLIFGDSIEMSIPISYIDKMLEKLDMVKCRHAAIPGL